MRSALLLVALVIAAGCQSPDAAVHDHMAPAALTTSDSLAYDYVSDGTRWLESGDLKIKMLLEASNFGSDHLEIGEITFPYTGQPGGGHIHQSDEVFYVLSGRFEHVVNGVANTLEPGGLAIVRKGDQVQHTVLTEDGVKALVIWTPGGEADRLVGYGFSQRPVE
ncbi:MAG: hypothetical protein RhofKO_08710 [Rhodothermales bacterium]